ncbi:hypothetical protein [Winogradskya humida]|uniref:NPCBM/NEW2 domain-containing protein n=1 Tax=Winogradskya humida TaxID=113566 RepID=A0ABQ3ZHE0_9ACTN|nr:hypothetical protein [Actinoplanes humidus]GIE17903.1 hypothetical protein Ahu01nite_010050 [Actinoplanes humidus]
MARKVPKSRGWRGWDTGVRATVLGTVAGILSLLVAFVAWQWPKSPPGPGATDAGAAPSAAHETAAGPGPSSAPQSPSGPAPAASAEYLNGFAAESGGAFLVAVPRPVRGKDGWTDRPIAISCPSNQTGDQEHSVTYLLKGRYVEFRADVRPYYPPDADERSATYVTALTGTRQRDGEVVTAEAGAQQRATAAQSQQLTATVDDAEKLTLRVQCGDPNGTVVLTGAVLIPAD